MSLVSNKKIFYINSNNRISGSHSNFTYHLNYDYNNNNYDSVVVLQALIPKSYYLVEDDDAMNYFTLRELGVDTNIFIPEGNYSRGSFQTAVQTLLNTHSPNTWTYTITFLPLTGKFQFNVTGNSSNQPSLLFNNEFYEPFGFEKDIVNSFVGSSLTSANIVNLNREDSLYIHSDIASNGTDDVLQEIFASSSADFTDIRFQNFNIEAYSKKLTSNSKNIYHFSLTDENGVHIDTNGVNLQITILLFESNNIYSMIRGYLKYLLIQN
jgi:hypothetical protein